MAILCFDFGGTAVKYGYYKQSELMGKGEFKTPSTWQEMKRELKKVYDHHQDQFGLIEGIAISAPGSVDSDRGIIEGISAIPYIHRFPIVTELKEWFAKPVTQIVQHWLNFLLVVLKKHARLLFLLSVLVSGVPFVLTENWSKEHIYLVGSLGTYSLPKRIQ